MPEIRGPSLPPMACLDVRTGPYRAAPKMNRKNTPEARACFMGDDRPDSHALQKPGLLEGHDVQWQMEGCRRGRKFQCSHCNVDNFDKEVFDGLRVLRYNPFYRYLCGCDVRTPRWLELIFPKQHLRS
mmetsp:Transcript_757/g.1767  ORF Transcript_757/g.1767 Transcript_757/m.1767 type:complete len:128 (+) Transcript_757:1670-2053(+)